MISKSVPLIIAVFLAAILIASGSAQSPQQVLLANSNTRLVFGVNPSGPFGLLYIEDLRSPYTHPVTSSSFAWEAEFVQNAAPHAVIKTESNATELVKSHSLLVQPDGTQILALTWANGSISSDRYSVTQTYTLKPNDITAQMRIEVEGSSLQQHSLKSIAPIFYYANLPAGSQSIVDWREGYIVTNPHKLSGFQRNGGFGIQNEQFGNLYSIFPPGTPSYLHLTINDPSGYVMYPRIQGDNSGLRYYFMIPGDKQSLPGQSFSPNLYFEIGAVKGKYNQDWWDSAARYKSWLSRQNYFPTPLLDRQDFPEYMKKLTYISVITPDTLPIAPGNQQTQDIITVLTAPHRIYGINDSVATFFGWGSNVVPHDMYGLSQPLRQMMITLKAQGVHSTAFVGSNYLSTQDIGYLNNPALASVRKLGIDGSPVCGNDPLLNMSCLFQPSSFVWQNFQSQSYAALQPSGLDGYYLDASIRGEDHNHNLGLYGGGPHDIQGYNARNDYLHQQNRPANPDFILWTEAAFDYLIGSSDFVLTTGASDKLGQANFFFNEQEQKDFDYIPLKEYLFSGRAVFGAALDRALAWGVLTADSAIKAEAIGLSYGRIISERPEGSATLYFNPPNGGPTAIQIGYSLIPSTWTPASTPVFTEVNAFRSNAMSTMGNHMKYTRFGSMMREPQTNSPIAEQTFYELPYWNTKVDFPSIPVSMWKAPDGSLGVFAINSEKTLQTISITIPFEDYGLVHGTSYRVYKRSNSNVTLLGSYSASFSFSATLNPYEASTFIIIDPQTDPDNDGEATQRSAGGPWDTCPTTYNPSQQDTDRDGFGDSCDCAPSNSLIHPNAIEICDGIDNNCNQNIDETCQCTPGQTGLCPLNLGVCQGQTRLCSPAGTWQSCSYSSIQGYEQNEQSCDTLDNDCDGSVDEGCECHAGQTQSCGSSVGICEQGTKICISGHWSSCNGGIVPLPAEICNNSLDDNCNGQADEGCVPPDLCTNSQRDPTEEGVDCGGPCPTPCPPVPTPFLDIVLLIILAGGLVGGVAWKFFLKEQI